jgi:hypothetical protein
MILSRYRFCLALRKVHHGHTPIPRRSQPSLTVLEVTVGDCGDGEGRECHDDGRSVTLT